MFEDFNIVFPLQKIDKEKRIVTGIATANNIDLEGDQIDFAASMEAFASWIGNIREMHDPKKAVGTMVDFRPTSIMHKGQMYDAIEVDVYISKGAEDTWQKILDKTLRGFSIGGHALEKESRYDPVTGSNITYISKYVMGELSVVDNPCNPAGMFMLIKRAKDGTLEDAVDENSKAVYYCADHKYATINDNKFCPSCSLEMTKIGSVDSFNVDVINKVISDFELTKREEGGSEIMDLHENTNDATMGNMINDLTDQQKTSILSKLGDVIFGGAKDSPALAVPQVTVNIHKGMFADEETVTEDKIEKVVETVEEIDAVEKSVDPSSETVVEDSDKEEEMDINEILKGVGSLLDEKLDAVKAEISAQVDEKIDAISKSVTELKEETEVTLSEAKDEIEKVANTGAIQKSVDVDDEEVEDKIEKSAPKTESFWGNVFVPAGFAEALGYES